jgi:DNA-binding NtrC family response regulator
MGNFSTEFWLDPCIVNVQRVSKKVDEAMEKVIGESDAVRQILKGFQLTHSLYVTSLLVGPPATGKRTLVRALFPGVPEVDAEDANALERALSIENELIITRFEKVADPERLDFQNTRIVAGADGEIPPRFADEKFAFIYRMPPLKERPEDIRAYTKRFLDEARRIFGYESEVDLGPERLEIGGNLRSLRASVYREVLLQSLSAGEIETALYHLFERTLEGNNAYRENLGILERPMLKAGLKRYGSQLKLSEILEINRNTLRKKLHEYRID